MSRPTALISSSTRSSAASELVAELERRSARQVTAFLSDNHFDPDVAAEILILDPPRVGEETPKAD